MWSHNRGLPCGAGIDICTDAESSDWEIFQAWGLLRGAVSPVLDHVGPHVPVWEIAWCLHESDGPWG